MTEQIKDVYNHCFGHICATGVISMMTLPEVLNTYTDSMCDDLKDCGVEASKESVKEYITKSYNELIKLQNKDLRLCKM